MKKGMALMVYSLSRLARSTDPVLTAKSKLAEVLNGLLGRDLSDAEVSSECDVDKKTSLVNLHSFNLPRDIRV